MVSAASATCASEYRVLNENYLFAELDKAYVNVKPFSLNLSWNDGLVEMLNDTQSVRSDTVSPEPPTEQSMRVSDASGTYCEVLLRHSAQKANRPRLRPIAVLSDLFGRSKSANSLGKTPPLPTRASHEEKQEKCPKDAKKKTSFWNKLGKSKRYAQKTAEEVAADERKRLALDSDRDWFELNDEELSLDYMRPSDVFNRMADPSAGLCSTVEPKLSGQYLNISSNILWSHNLSLSRLSNGDVSNVNLLGANVNREQIHSEVYIEDAERRPICARRRLKFALASVDSGGYAVMRPILPAFCEPLPDGDTAEADASGHYEYMHLRQASQLRESFDGGSSSGFSSDMGDSSPLPSRSFSCELTPKRDSLIDEAISMTFSDSATPPSHRARPKPVPRKLCQLPRNRSDNDLLTPISRSTSDDITASLFDIPSKCAPTVRSATPYKLHTSNRLRIYAQNSKAEEHSPPASVGNRSPEPQTIRIDSSPPNEKSPSLQKRLAERCSKIRKRAMSLVALSPRHLPVFVI